MLSAAVNAVTSTMSNEPYDPYKHRKVPNATTNSETFLHLLKCCLGTGILAMPQAFGRAGLITASVSTFFVAFLVLHTLAMLFNSMYELCKRARVPELAYPKALQAALQAGPPFMSGCAGLAPFFVDFFMVVYQLGVCCVYILFISDNLRKMIDPTKAIEIYMVGILPFLILFNLIPNLKILAPFSGFANFITLIGLAIILYLVLTEPGSNEPIDYFGTVTAFPLFLGTMMFALTSIPVVVSLERNMKHPENYVTLFGVLNLGIMFVAVLYVIVAAIGYLYCRSQCSDSITLDLPPGALATSVQLMMVAAIFISYILNCYVPVEVLWKQYMQPSLERRGSTSFLLYEYTLRISLCLLTSCTSAGCNGDRTSRPGAVYAALSVLTIAASNVVITYRDLILAVSVPQLGLFITLFGALCLPALAMIFPCIMHICVCYPNKFGPVSIILIKDLILIAFAFFCQFIGTSAAVRGIILTFFKEPPPTNATTTTTTTAAP